MKWEEVLEHYLKPEVRKEIIEYCRNRWIAIHCEERDRKGISIMIRYDKLRRPLKISSESDFQKLFEDYAEFRPRAFYATAHIYEVIDLVEDTMDRGNIEFSSPTWDVDSKDGDWRKVVEKALEIIDLLERNGVSKSVFFKWSGRGAHVHIHPKAFSEDVRRRIDPLDIAYSISQYVTNRVTPSEGVIVENKMDIQRVFTAPLSLHRTVDRVAVCIPPNQLESFHIEWADPSSYRHFPTAWRVYEEGEGDELAEKSFSAIGPYIAGRTRRRKHKPLDKEILEALRKFDAI